MIIEITILLDYRIIVDLVKFYGRFFIYFEIIYGILELDFIFFKLIKIFEGVIFF